MRRVLDNGPAGGGPVKIIDRLGDGDSGSPVLPEAPVAMLHEGRCIAEGQKIPGLINNDDLGTVSFPKVHGLLDLIDQLQKHHLLEVLSALEFLKFQYRQIASKADCVPAMEEAAIFPPLGEGKELLPKINDPLIGFGFKLLSHIIDRHSLAFFLPDIPKNPFEGGGLEIGELFGGSRHAGHQTRNHIGFFLPVLNQIKGIDAEIRFRVERHELSLKALGKIHVGAAHINHPNPGAFCDISCPVRLTRFRVGVPVPGQSAKIGRRGITWRVPKVL